MARKEKTSTITDEGRDKGKTFVLREMPCAQAEKWALRALSAAARSGVDIGSVPNGGMAGIAAVGIEAMFRIGFDEAEPLLDELFSCVRIVRDPKHPEMSFPLLEEDIEEVQTRLLLRVEVMKLHVDFSAGAAPLSSTSETAPKAEGLSSTRTSPPSSGQRSRIVRRR